jgi:hypothetical protein
MRSCGRAERCFKEMAVSGCAKTVVFTGNEEVLAGNTKSRITGIQFGEYPRE